jgi:hypothetical protein
MIPSFVKKNKDALRWCRNRRATIKFKDSDTGVVCMVDVSGFQCIDKTMVKAVNWLIKAEKEMKTKPLDILLGRR